MALLRCNEAQVALIAACRSSALLGLVSLIFLLTIPPYILYGVQVGRVCWPIKHSNTMVIEPALVALALCAGAKSCWKMKSASPKSLSAEGSMKCSKISW